MSEIIEFYGNAGGDSEASSVYFSDGKLWMEVSGFSAEVPIHEMKKAIEWVDRCHNGNIVLLNHRGYKGTINMNVEDGFIYGHVLGNEEITYDGQTLTELTECFKKTVDRHIEKMAEAV